MEHQELGTTRCPWRGPPSRWHPPHLQRRAGLLPSPRGWTGPLRLPSACCGHRGTGERDRGVPELGAGLDLGVSLSQVEKNAEGCAGARPFGKRRTYSLVPSRLSSAFWNLGTVLRLFHARAHLIVTTTERGPVTTEAEREGRSHKPRTQGQRAATSSWERHGQILPPRLRQEPALPTPPPWISGLQSYENTFLPLKLPSGYWLWQPWETHSRGDPRKSPSEEQAEPECKPSLSPWSPGTPLTQDVVCFSPLPPGSLGHQLFLQKAS